MRNIFNNKQLQKAIAELFSFDKIRSIFAKPIPIVDENGIESDILLAKVNSLISELEQTNKEIEELRIIIDNEDIEKSEHLRHKYLRKENGKYIYKEKQLKDSRKFITTTIREYLNENIYNEIPQPFSGIDVIGMATFGNKEHPTDAYEAFSEQYDLPDEPILYIHSFFPKKEYKGKGLTKKYLLMTLSDWANHKLNNKELINNIGKRSLDNFGGSDFFGTSSFYDEGEKFFNNLIENGFLEKVHLNKTKEGRALNLFKITNKTKNINI